MASIVNRVTPSLNAHLPAFRSGVAARLAGVPAQTLRIWEHRYGVISPNVSAGGQRLYSAPDVDRLVLIKALVDAGHAIGSIARLPTSVLQAMRGSMGMIARRDGVTAPSSEARVALVGPLVSVLEFSAPALHVIQRFADVNAAGQANALDALALAVVEVATLSDQSLTQMTQLKETLAARQMMVLYRFAPGPVIRRLRQAGIEVMRAPSDAQQIESVCLTALQMPVIESKSTPTTLPASPRFDEQALARLATTSNSLYCECPRQLAELLVNVNSFERYSLECQNRGPEDAQLHRDLHRAAGEAREILETALSHLMRVEGLSSGT